MSFWDLKHQCKSAWELDTAFDKDGHKYDICKIQSSLKCCADSCPSRHYWSIGKQKQIGWTRDRALERVELVGQFEEEMCTS